MREVFDDALHLVHHAGHLVHVEEQDAAGYAGNADLRQMGAQDPLGLDGLHGHLCQAKLLGG